jgi:peptide/nickel transport system ATP-binding protein
MANTVLEVRDLWVEYPARRGVVKAVRGVSFELCQGETLALIGESGSGKTTLGLSLVRLLPKTARVRRGSILFHRNGHVQDVLALSEEGLRQFRWRDCAMVFQGAQNAFNPVLRVESQFYDTARAHGMGDATKVKRRAVDLLRMVQLDPDRVFRSFPHELSGGMRQRVLIALGLLLQPQVIILDEPTTALDILTQRSIIDLLRRLKAELDFSLIFISHDLSLSAELADRVATVYAGAIVEIGGVYDIFEHARHPYTRALTHSVPTVTGELRNLTAIPGSPPDLIVLPVGCSFHPRCPFATQRCREEEPPLEPVGEGQLAACWNWREVM